MSIFSQVPPTKISRSTHRLNHSFKMTGDFGGIYPILTELSFAGDSWRVDLEQLVRSMPMIAPVMDMVDIKVDAFFCPIRLVWDGFEDFITLGTTGESGIDTWPTLLRPAVTPSDSNFVSKYNKIFAQGGLSDYLNFPSYRYAVNIAAPSRELDALPFRVYQTIYNEYYLNENLDTPIPVQHAGGAMELTLSAQYADRPNYVDNFFIRYRGWNKDYFTSALPFPQKGPAVRIPMSGDVEIKSDGYPLALETELTDPATWDDQNIQASVESYDSHGNAVLLPYVEDGDDPVSLKFAGGLKGKILTATAPSIEELRYAEVLQEYYEVSARGGSRPKEYYLNIWHTPTKDARLDRPEYLGGYRGPITITDIDQTSQSDISAQATPAGKGISAGGNKIIKYHCPEHGYLMVLVSITPRSSYCQGFRKQNLYRDPFDFPCPMFGNLGEQEILNKELYDDPSDGKNDETFGYTPRYAECKYIPSTVHGQLKTTLNYWTLVRLFGSRPNLNSAFVHINPDELARIFPDQVSNNDKFVATFYFKIKRRMYLPYYGVPRLVHSV